MRQEVFTGAMPRENAQGERERGRAYTAGPEVRGLNIGAVILMCLVLIG